MTQAINFTAGNHRAPKALRGLEQFETQPGAVWALLAVEPLPHSLWDPCGEDNSLLAKTLRTAGHHVVATDLAVDGIDFRARRKAPRGVRGIVTNPPFSLAADFVRHGLLLVKKVVILERIQFFESADRRDLMESGRLARIYAFADRVPRMHRADWTGNKAEPAMFSPGLYFYAVTAAKLQSAAFGTTPTKPKELNMPPINPVTTTTSAEPTLPPRLQRAFEKLDPKRGRAGLMLDATGSRQARWDPSMGMQQDMCRAIADTGRLDVQLGYHRGGTEFSVLPFVSNPRALQAKMSEITCRSGPTQILRVLKHVRRAHATQALDCTVYIGDQCEETAGDLYDAATGLGVPFFMFQEGDDTTAREIFIKIAELTGGAFAELNNNSALTMAELLKAVAAFAMDGAKALSNQNSEAAKLLLTQIKK